MTLREFAKAIKISPGTVSKAFGVIGKYRISTERIAYIQNKAKELGFRAGEPESVCSRKKRIGIVCGPSLSHLGVYFLGGARKVASEIGAEVHSCHCDNSVKAEAEAFRLMLHENVDAIIYWSGMQAKADSRWRLEKLQQEVGRHVPVIYTHEETRPDILSINYHEEENARAAARRQLELGCRRFAVLRYYRYWGIDEQATRAYCDELRKYGVSPRRIKMFLYSPYTSSPDDFAAIREIQGVWLEQCHVLLTLAPTLAKYTDLKTLHIDGMEYIEAFNAVNMICNPFFRQEGQKLDLSWLCGSSGIKFCSLQTLGIQAMEFAVSHVDQADVELPRQIDLTWLTLDEVLSWNNNITWIEKGNVRSGI